MKKTILFRNLRNHSNFIYKGELYRKQSDAFSLRCKDGHDLILAGKDKVEVVEDKHNVRFI